MQQSSDLFTQAATQQTNQKHDADRMIIARYSFSPITHQIRGSCLVNTAQSLKGGGLKEF
jgi:hypothetical protein